MHKLLHASATGKRYVDKPVKVCTRDGDDGYIHAEIQAHCEADFGLRVKEYNDKAEDRHRHPVVSVALLLDDDPDWRPASYVYEKWGFRKVVAFPLVKTLDWSHHEANLWQQDNSLPCFCSRTSTAGAPKRTRNAMNSNCDCFSPCGSGE